jgi:hypothetical protein
MNCITLTEHLEHIREMYAFKNDKRYNSDTKTKVVVSMKLVYSVSLARRAYKERNNIVDIDGVNWDIGTRFASCSYRELKYCVNSRIEDNLHFTKTVLSNANIIRDYPYVAKIIANSVKCAEQDIIDINNYSIAKYGLAVY